MHVLSILTLRSLLPKKIITLSYVCSVRGSEPWARGEKGSPPELGSRGLQPRLGPRTVGSTTPSLRNWPERQSCCYWWCSFCCWICGLELNPGVQVEFASCWGWLTNVIHRVSGHFGSLAACGIASLLLFLVWLQGKRKEQLGNRTKTTTPNLQRFLLFFLILNRHHQSN